MTTLTTRTFSSRAALDTALTERLGRALTARGASAVMLAGGSTPMAAYRSLARQPLVHDDRLHVLFSDERYVPADSSASNYHQSRPLLDALALPAESLLRVRTELPLDEAAAAYDAALTTLLSAGIHIGLGLLGLGADGHTASLFTPGDIERARGRYALAVQRPDGMSAVWPPCASRCSWWPAPARSTRCGRCWHRTSPSSPGARCRAARTSSCGTRRTRERWRSLIRRRA